MFDFWGPVLVEDSWCVVKSFLSFFFFFFFFFRGLCPELLSLLRRNFVGMWWCEVGGGRGRGRGGAWW